MPGREVVVDAEPGIGAALLVHQQLIAEQADSYHPRQKNSEGISKSSDPVLLAIFASG